MCLTRGYNRCRDYSANTEGHTYLQEKDCSTQSSTCSPWGSHIKSLPSLRKKMAAYMEERQTITNLFNWSFPNRPNPSLFAKLSKATLKRNRTSKATPKKRKRNYTPSKGLLSKPSPREHSAYKADGIMVLYNEVSYCHTCHSYSHT